MEDLLNKSVKAFYTCFIVMKLTGVITLSWLWLLLPIVAPFALLVLIMVLVLVSLVIISIIFSIFG